MTVIIASFNCETMARPIIVFINAVTLPVMACRYDVYGKMLANERLERADGYSAVVCLERSEVVGPEGLEPSTCRL